MMSNNNFLKIFVYSDRDLGLHLGFISNKASIEWHDVTSKKLDLLAPGSQQFVSLRLLPFEVGLRVS